MARAQRADEVLAPRAAFGPGVLLGLGLGGFVDGIVLHQILQWHHLVSSVHPTGTVSGLETNTVWDGIFHAATWLCVLAGTAWLWRRAIDPRDRRWIALVGPLVTGWGLFNLLDSVVNHYLLGIHHVRAGAHERAYDVAFLVLAVALVAAGLALHRATTRASGRRTRERR